VKALARRLISMKIHLMVKNVKILQGILTKKKSTIGDFYEFEDSSDS
jgi:hypothetical protein